MPDLYHRLKAIRGRQGTGVPAGRAPATPHPERGTLAGVSGAADPTADAGVHTEAPAAWESPRPLVWRRDSFLPLSDEFASLVADPATGRLRPEFLQYRFLDTETTGLSGGAGTWVFLAGWSRLVEEEGRIGLLVRQYFLEDLGGESDFVDLIDADLSAGREGAPCHLVSYNGASFDLPLLRTRWILNGRHFPELGHTDCVHVSRRLWRVVAGRANLGTIESLVLGIRRPDDIPGALVPRLYLDYLRRGAGPGFAAELEGVFRHHAQDMVSLAGLWLVLRGLGDGEGNLGQRGLATPEFWLPWMPGDPLPPEGEAEVERRKRVEFAAGTGQPPAAQTGGRAVGLLPPVWPRGLPVHARGLLRLREAQAGLEMARAGWRGRRAPAWGILLASLCKSRGLRGEAFGIWMELWQAHSDVAALIECLKHLEHHGGPEGRERALDLLLRARLHPLAARPQLAGELDRRETRLRRLLGRSV